VPRFLRTTPADLARERIKPIKALADQDGYAVHYGERARYAIEWRVNRLLPEEFAVLGIQTVSPFPAGHIQTFIHDARGAALATHLALLDCGKY
jgi:hypothetical protein